MNGENSIRVYDTGGVTVVAVSGELDIATSPRLAVILGETLRAAPRAIVIDLTGTGFVDSTGLAVLLNALRRSVRAGIELRLACDVRSILKLLALTRLDRDFEVLPTLEAAFAASATPVQPATPGRPGEPAPAPR